MFGACALKGKADRVSSYDDICRKTFSECPWSERRSILLLIKYAIITIPFTLSTSLNGCGRGAFSLSTDTICASSGLLHFYNPLRTRNCRGCKAVLTKLAIKSGGHIRPAQRTSRDVSTFVGRRKLTLGCLTGTDRSLR